jgi:Uma2 family endonuclease
MAGTSQSHNLIAGNAFAALHGQLRGRGCEVYTNDMRLRASAADLLTYPDVAVAYDPQFADEEVDTLLNPKLIIEVLSLSTESDDRGAKFGAYRTIPLLCRVHSLGPGPVLCRAPSSNSQPAAAC